MMTDQHNTQNYGSTQIPFQQPPASATTTPISTIDNSYQHQAYTSFARYFGDDEDDEEKSFATLLNEHLLATPFIFSVLFAFMLLPYSFTLDFDVIDVNQLKWKEFILGASGWSLAFLIRKPLSIIFVRLGTVGSILMLFSIGLVEEIFRLGWLYHIPREYPEYPKYPEYPEKGNELSLKFLAAYWLGVGWEAAEAIYFIVQNFIEVKRYKYNLYSRFVEERQDLEDILGKPFTRISAWWGVMWRTSWTMAHIGFSCWITWNFWLVFPAAMIHGLLDVVWGCCLPAFGIPATSYGTFMVTLCVFLIGLGLFGIIY